MVVSILGGGGGGGYAEANLSAKEAEAQANTRFLGTSIEQGRAEGPEAAPKEGSHTVERWKAAGEEAKLEGRVTTAIPISVNDRVVHGTLKAPGHGAEDSTPTQERFKTGL
jgi:hypothetical protein